VTRVRFQNYVKTPEPEFSKENTMQICNYDDERTQPPPTMEEDDKAIHELNTNKSLWVDNLQAELLKYGSKEMFNKLCYL
jgi:hypothetical protein